MDSILAIFQLGESGEGSTIRRYAKKVEGITGLQACDRRPLPPSGISLPSLWGDA